ncbi:hypothetical protein TWF481_007624 [Arthrobotrys musiformis]|uniref:DUF7779 domain-containing protein n=1 Tax=Arthrobotrys musiformis TaxID=47236 RepID=A0AAV9WC65_9PEZI
MEDSHSRLSRKEYTVGWLCGSTDSDRKAAMSMLDVRHERCELLSDDGDSYTCGSINGHNVVIACLPPGMPGTNSAVKLTQLLSQSFPNLRIHLYVGTGSGIPRNPAPGDSKDDIHLGDVVVGCNKQAGVPSIVQYRLENTDLELGGNEVLGTVDKPDHRLLDALAVLEGNHRDGKTKLTEHLGRSTFSHPGLEYDNLYESTYLHSRNGRTCSTCDPCHIVDRPKRATMDLIFHQGTILSGNAVVDTADMRDRLSEQFHGAICAETDAAGIMAEKGALVIKGICDYADPHKNREWQPYAAATAAAFARELLYTIAPLSAGRDAIRKSEEQRIPLSLPAPRNYNFKGREEVLGKARKSFWSNDPSGESPAHDSGRRVVSLCGLDGSGKTHTALEYAYRHSKEYSAIFWLNATNEIELEKSARKAVWYIINANTKNAERGTKEDSNRIYLRTARTLGLDGRALASDEDIMKAAAKFSSLKCLKHWLGRESISRWLLILDNYDDPPACAESLHNLLPAKDSGHILITSRIQQSYESCIDVEMSTGMEQSDAVELLFKRAGETPLPESWSPQAQPLTSPFSLIYLEYQSVLALVDSIGGLPLSIELVGAYLRKFTLPFDSYRVEPLKEPLDKIHAICEVSFRKLSREAKHLIQLLSLIGNDDIPYKLLEAGREFVDWMGSARNALNKVIGELLSLSMISERQDNGYQIHPLVHQWVRDHTNNAVVKNSRLIVDIVTSTFISGDERSASQWAYEYRILPHIESCLEIFFKYLAPADGAIDEKGKRIAHNLARVYKNLGDTPRSNAIYERSLKHMNTQPSCLDLKIMDAFGVNLGLQGEYEDALRWCTKALDGAKSRGTEDSLESLTVTSHIAAIFRAKGDYSKAITKYRWVLKQQEDKLGHSHPQTLETQHQLAGVLVDSKEYVEASDLLERVKQGNENRLGKEHHSILGIIDEIATNFERRGSYGEALKTQRLIYESRKQTLGGNHHSTLGSQTRIAQVYENLGQYDECLAQQQVVLQQLENIFGEGEDHPWILHTLSGMADILMRLGRQKEAEEAYRKAHAGFKRLSIGVNGELPVANKISRSLCDQGKYKEALKWSKEAEIGFEETTKDSSLLIAAKVCTASIYAFEENYQTALDIYEEVLSIYEKKDDAANRTGAPRTELSMGEIFMKQGRYQKAIEFLTRAEERLLELASPGHQYAVEATELRNQAHCKLDEEVQRKKREEESRQKRAQEEEVRREEEERLQKQEEGRKRREQEEKRELQQQKERKLREQEEKEKLREQEKRTKVQEQKKEEEEAEEEEEERTGREQGVERKLQEGEEMEKRQGVQEEERELQVQQEEVSSRQQEGRQQNQEKKASKLRRKRLWRRLNCFRGTRDSSI